MIAALASLAIVTIVLRCLWLWQPERQLLLHQASLRAAIEGRRWDRVAALMDSVYSDRWGYTRETGVTTGRQWLGQFFTLTITAEPVDHSWTSGGGTVKERWRMEGTGTEVCGLITDRVNSLQTPFIFTWKHGSWKPWDWRLMRVDNEDPTLDLRAPDI